MQLIFVGAGVYNHEGKRATRFRCNEWRLEIQFWCEGERTSYGLIQHFCLPPDCPEKSRQALGGRYRIFDDKDIGVYESFIEPLHDQDKAAITANPVADVGSIKKVVDYIHSLASFF